MSKKNSLLNFVNLVNLLVEPWTTNRIKEYESLFSKLKTNREKVAIMILSIMFQVPKISIKSSKILSEKCHIPINEIPNSLPQTVFNCLLRLLPVLSVKKDMTYTKVALICASSLPPSQLRNLFEVFIKYPEFHLANSIYSVMFDRDPTLTNFLSDNFEKCENLLPYAFSSFSLQPFSNEFILKVASLFLSGKMQTTSSFFYSFCFYINRRIFPIDFESTDYFVLTLFQKIETFFAPYSHSYLFNLITKTLDEFPLPFISIHLFFQDFDENQIKSVFSSLIKENGSIKSFFVLSQVAASEKMKELYSIATCTRFCTYTIMKKNIYFFKRSLERITSLHFELRVLSKILEIASIPDFEDVSFEFLEIFKPFTATAVAMSDILKIFFTRDKKLISGMITRNAENKASILTALYLLGNSPIAANPKLKTRFKSLTKALIPRLNISNLKINCLMPKSLSSTLTKKNLTNEELSLFFYNLTVRQIKPAPFNVDNALNIISLFQMSREELGYKIKENEQVPPDAFDKIMPNLETDTNSNKSSQNKNQEADQITRSKVENDNIDTNQNFEAKTENQNQNQEAINTISSKSENKNIINLKKYSVAIASIQPTLKQNEHKTKKRQNNLIIQSFSENINQFLQIENYEQPSKITSDKPINFSIQSTVIMNIKQDGNKNQNKEPLILDFQSIVVSDLEPMKTAELSVQSSVVSDFQPIPKKKEKLSIQETFAQIINIYENEIQRQIETSAVVSMVPAKTNEEIQLENIKKISISKYNTSTQTKPKKNELKMTENQQITDIFSKKNELKITEKQQIADIFTKKNNELKITEKQQIADIFMKQKKDKISICYNTNNNFETSMLSDDVLSSQESFDFEEPVQKPAKNKTTANIPKVSETKKQKQFKITENKNQKQLKIPEVKNQKQLKISDTKNQNQKKVANKETSKELSKSHSYSITKFKSNPNEKEIKQKPQPNLPKPPSEPKKSLHNQRQNQSIEISPSKDLKNIQESNMPRPKSMNNMASEGEEILNISSDDTGFALPSDDYEFSGSKSSYSLSGLSEFDENELNQMFGDDEQVQMFADMLLPPDK